MDIIANSFEAIVLKLILAIVLGALLGLERSLAKKTAGMRTYTLVSLGAALFMIVSEIIGTEGYAAFDPSRVASQIVVGIGFLGAGLIIFQGNKVRGLTTAAGLWVAAGLGMAAGLGLYWLAIVATILTLLVFTVFWYIEQYFGRNVADRAEKR